MKIRFDVRIILRTILFVSLMLTFSKCTGEISAIQNPEWIDKLIIQFKNEPVGNPPQSIWQYKYLNQTVYYVPPQCCDQYSTLYDENGKLICAPDGGLTGNGDGKCPDFFEKRTDEKIIWKDERQR
jgi:hypothetical protein